MSYPRLITAVAALCLATPLLVTLCAQDNTARDSLLVARPEARIAAPAQASPPAPIVAAGVTAPRRADSRTSVNAALSQEPSESSHSRALMIVGGTAVVVGAIVGGKGGALAVLGGAIVGLYGLWRYVQ